jgi:hypothetical protein
MSRIGKIARLPEQIRAQLNCRLQDGEAGPAILAWLNSTKQVKTVLDQQFGGRKITASNLSDWRLGGYRDWETQQITLDEARRVVSEGGQLAKTGNKAMADNLAVWLTGRYVAALRRGDHGAEWLRIEREKLKLQSKKQQSDREKLKQEILKENPPRKVLSPEEKARRYQEILGIDPDTYPTCQNKTPFNPDPDADDEAAPPPDATPTASFPNLNLPTPADDLPPINPILPMAPISTEEAEAQEVQRESELAEQGHALSAYSLGARYRDGIGVPKDLAKAREWLGKAASQGIGSAKIDLHGLVMRFGD